MYMYCKQTCDDVMFVCKQDNAIPLRDDEVDYLLNELDKDGDGEINYR